MSEARNLILFVLAIAAGFIYICSVIPQIKSEPIVEELVIGASPEELTAAGKKIFMSDRSQCLTCHSLDEDPKARCPNQEGIGERASNRKPGFGAAEYLIESLYSPNAYIVSGYPKDQMRPINKPPIALSHDEILAVVAYLNTLGGATDGDFVERVRKAQEPWRQGLLNPEEGGEQFKPPIFQGDAGRGWQMFQDAGCIQCHRVGTEGSDTCPELTQIGASQSAGYLLESVLDPNAVIVRGYKDIIVIWKLESRQSIQGTVVAWLPDREHPRALRMNVLRGGELEEQQIDLTQVACVGDTIVMAEMDGESEPLCGQYISGDEKTGITLAFLEEGGWAERRIPPEAIGSINFPMSRMPGNYAELMTPRMVYDLIAFLVGQEGEQ